MKCRKSLVTTLPLVGVFCVFVAARAGDPVTDAQNKLLAKRAAEADCYRKLAETVYGVKLNSNTYVRDFVT
ncbi:MAG: lipoprotein required for motility, partial [Planctomycetes bacterium]|nr:lipoprotein required for motility [Planctomycetota bacterium]